MDIDFSLNLKNDKKVFDEYKVKMLEEQDHAIVSLDADSKWVVPEALKRKVDENGNFKPYFGDTVVMNLSDSQVELLKNLQDKLYMKQSDILAKRLVSEKFHITIHDLSSNVDKDSINPKMFTNERECKKVFENLKKHFEKHPEDANVKLKPTCVYPSANISIALGFLPKDEKEHKKITDVYGALDNVVPLNRILRLHATIAYFKPHVLTFEERKILRDTLKSLPPSDDDFNLDLKKLVYQHFESMNDYIDKFSITKRQKEIVSPNIVSISKNGENILEKDKDGGIKVDDETKTVVYLEKDALAFLEKTIYFKKDTQVINPSNGILRVSVNGESATFNKTGAVLIREGTKASVKVLEGKPLVISTENKPSWYEAMGYNNVHEKMIGEITKINESMQKGHVLKSSFQEKVLKKLLSNDVLLNIDEKHVVWSDFKTDLDLEEKLKQIGFGKKEILGIIKRFESYKQREFYAKESGRIIIGSLDEDLVKKLVDEKILVEFVKKSKSLFWSNYQTRDSLEKTLDKLDITDTKKDTVLNLWEKTNRSGFDDSGLIWEKGGITIYSLPQKINLWNGEKTEWIVNSTEYADGGVPFSIGVSSVVYDDLNEEKPTCFKDIRQSECLHKHPDEPNKWQKEVYYILGGSASLLTVEDGNIKIKVLNQGDMAVINPGVPHCMMALKGRYEHMVFQVPSAFQYGFALKQDVNFEDFGITEKDAIKLALEKLA